MMSYEYELIRCNPNTGIDSKEVVLLRTWPSQELSGSINELDSQ
jgi:hypothetical protein